MIRVAPIHARALYQKDPEPTREPDTANSKLTGAQQMCSFTQRQQDTTAPVCYLADEHSLPPPPTGTVRERFMADTGANRSIHPNGRAAATFY